MSGNAIEIRNLGKKYTIGARQTKNDTFVSALTSAVSNPVRRMRDVLTGRGAGAAQLYETLWALRDITFDIEQGEVIGIIGRNGAGKSTLLKILSRITDPTEGSVRLNGRVGSLLEVGTGFHGDLTGRENVYLNGSILGMSQAEITSKFDEIVAFSGVEKFIDTPVKHYSSGMNVRLAFAVAAHLEPEILIIDEVLSVGDYAFQRKSLGKMQDVTKGGRTVLFVSHQLDMVQTLCTRCVLLENGRVKMIGPTHDVIEAYMAQPEDDMSGQFEAKEELDRPFQLVRGRVLNQIGKIVRQFDVFEPITFEFEYVLREPTMGLSVSFVLQRAGEPLLMSYDTDAASDRFELRQPGHYRTRVTLPTPLLKAGQYTVDASAGVTFGRTSKSMHRVTNALTFDVELLSKSGSLSSYAASRPGKLALELDWSLESIAEGQTE